MRYQEICIQRGPTGPADQPVDRQRWHDDVARMGNSRSPVLQMRTTLEDFLCFHDAVF